MTAWRCIGLLLTLLLLQNNSYISKHPSSTQYEGRESCRITAAHSTGGAGEGVAEGEYEDDKRPPTSEKHFPPLPNSYLKWDRCVCIYNIKMIDLSNLILFSHNIF